MRGQALTLIQRIQVGPSTSGESISGHALEQDVGVYRRQADKVLSRKAVAPAYRKVVERYFNSLSK